MVRTEISSTCSMLARVRRHDGRTWAEAEVGKGAVLFFTLATAAEEAADAGSVGEKAHG